MQALTKLADWWREPVDVRAVADKARTWVRAAESNDYRWERERGRYLKESGGKAGNSRRRRSQQLLAKAHRAHRAGLGVGRAEIADDPIPPFYRRWTSDTDVDESMRRWVLIGLCGSVAAVLVGPGVAAGYGLYRRLEARSPKIGRLWVWPWLAAAVVALVILWAGGLLTFGAGLHTIPYLPLVWPGMGLVEFVISWVCWQAVIALAATAYYIRAWGWAAVPAGAVVPPKQNPDGTWRETPEAEKVDIGFDLADYEQWVPPEPFDDNGIDENDIDEEDR